jgi:hypothetical protein
VQPVPVALSAAIALFLGLTSAFVALLVLECSLGNRVATVVAAVLATGAAWLVMELWRERRPNP